MLGGIVSILSLSIVAHGLWPPQSGDAFALSWANYHPSSEKACFYYADYSESLEDGFGILDYTHVGPVAFKEDLTINVSKTFKFSKFQASLAVGYMLVPSSAIECPDTPVLANITGGGDTSKTLFSWNAKSHLAPDFAPRLVLSGNGALREEEAGYHQGLYFDIRNAAPLTCTFDVSSFSLVNLEFLSTLSAFSRVSFNELYIWKKEHLQCGDALVKLQCQEAKPKPDGEVDPTMWGVSPRAANDTFNADVNISSFLRSVCDLERFQTALLQMTIIGDGSDKFPFEVVTTTSPPSKFDCPKLCVAPEGDEEGDEKPALVSGAWSQVATTRLRKLAATLALFFLRVV